MKKNSRQRDSPFANSNSLSHFAPHLQSFEKSMEANYFKAVPQKEQPFIAPKSNVHQATSQHQASNSQLPTTPKLIPLQQYYSKEQMQNNGRNQDADFTKNFFQGNSTSIMTNTQKQNKTSMISQDKLFLKNISLKNLRNIYKPSQNTSNQQASASFYQQFNNKNFSNVLQQMETQNIQDKVHKVRNTSDPFNLIMYQQENAGQMNNKSKRKQLSSTIDSQENLQKSRPTYNALKNGDEKSSQRKAASLVKKPKKHNYNTINLKGGRNAQSQKDLLASQSPSSSKVNKAMLSYYSISSQGWPRLNQISKWQKEETSNFGSQVKKQASQKSQKSSTRKNNSKSQKSKKEDQNMQGQEKQCRVSIIEPSFSNSGKKTLQNENECFDQETQKMKLTDSQRKVLQKISNQHWDSYRNSQERQKELSLQLKAIDREMIHQLAKHDSNPVTIYSNALLQVGSAMKQAKDLLQKITAGFQQHFKYEDQKKRGQLSELQVIIEDLQVQYTTEKMETAKYQLEIQSLTKSVNEYKKNLVLKDKLLSNMTNEMEVERKKRRQFLGKYDENKILDEIKVLVNENQELKSAVREIKSELDYGKQRENKLMYFLFLLQHQGIPIYDIFDLNIKDLPTSKFSPELDDHYKSIYYAQKKKLFERGILPFNLCESERIQRVKYFKDLRRKDVLNETFHTEQSFYPICDGPPILPEKPSSIPNLDLKKVELVKQKFLEQQRQQELLKQMEGEGSDDDSVIELSLGIRSTTRLQEILRKSKYDQLEYQIVDKFQQIREQIEQKKALKEAQNYTDEQSATIHTYYQEMSSHYDHQQQILMVDEDEMYGEQEQH